MHNSQINISAWCPYTFFLKEYIQNVIVTSNVFFAFLTLPDHSKLSDTPVHIFSKPKCSLRYVLLYIVSASSVIT